MESRFSQFCKSCVSSPQYGLFVADYTKKFAMNEIDSISLLVSAKKMGSCLPRRKLGIAPSEGVLLGYAKICEASERH